MVNAALLADEPSQHTHTIIFESITGPLIRTRALHTSGAAAQHGFYLSKTAFWDAIHLRYEWKHERLPDKCVCGVWFSVEHALTSPRGGFTFVRPNEIRDMTANLLSEVCHGVQTEPDLQPLTGRPCYIKQQNGKRIQGWTFGHRASGERDGRMPFLT